MVKTMEGVKCMLVNLKSNLSTNNRLVNLNLIRNTIKSKKSEHSSQIGFTFTFDITILFKDHNSLMPPGDQLITALERT